VIEATHDDATQEEGEVVSEDVAFYIGVSIVTGFTIMLSIDEIFKILKHKCSTRPNEAN